MDANFSLSKELYDVVEKQKPANILNKGGNKSDSASNQPLKRQNENFSATRQQHPSSSHNYIQRVVSAERIPQNTGSDKRKELSVVQARRDFNEVGKSSFKGYSRDLAYKSDNNTTERINKSGKGTNLMAGRYDKERMTAFGYNRLKMLSQKDSTEIIMVLTNNKDEFNSLLNKDLSPDKIMLVAEILANLSGSSLKQNKAAVLANTVQPHVLEMFSSHSCQIFVKDFRYTEKTIVHYFENLAVFYKDVIEVLPNTAVDHLKEHLSGTIMAINSLKNLKNITVSAELEKRFMDLLSTLKLMAVPRKPNDCNKKTMKETREWKSGTDFREVSIFPLPKDVLLQSEIQLTPVVVNGPYKNVEHYLDVHFHLMREDFLIPLRNGIMNFIDQNSSKTSRLKRIENVRFYKGVQFLTHFIEGETLVSEIAFDPRGRMKKINWKRSKRFMYGSLVCFSCDSFQTIFLGLIANRSVELLNKGLLQVELIGDINEMNLFGKEFTMAENEIYFEAYQHVLKALKTFNNINFPLQEYIINVSSEVILPKYMAINPDKWYDFRGYDFQVLDQRTWPSMGQLKVNESQFKALYSALTQKVAIIQGPPGTGKTYLGLIIAELLLHNSESWRNRAKGPILVVCYTNHALDQFLEGILTFTKNIVRVGGQSRNEKMGDYNLRVQRRKRGSMHYALSKIEDCLRNSRSRMDEANNFVKQFLKRSGIISLAYFKQFVKGQHNAWFYVEGEYKDSLLIEWLLEGAYYYNDYVYEEQLNNFEPVPEDFIKMYACTLKELQMYVNHLESDMLIAKGHDLDGLIHMSGIYRSRLSYLKEKLMQPLDGDIRLITQLDEVRNLSQLDHEQRWVLYNYWIYKAIHHYHDTLTEIRKDYQRLSNQKSEIINALSLQAMTEADVVGITTTGAAKQQTLLQSLGAKIVIVEEAAEVMESHVVVSLSDKCEHLILIGDHKQLRPSPAVYKLAKDYNFDVSLFERMLRNNVPHDILDIQHRMRPEIADLIIPAIYPALKNHKSVLKYENILGIKKNLFFITHTNQEEMVMDDTSKKNIQEARFLIALCRHLVLQGYDPSQITLLTVYVGQMFTILEERDKYSIVQDVRVTCVDNYQGEENDIILLSLVRNNEEGKVGFLATDNRVCVALSRAKKGLYIMGNIEMLSAKSPLWTKVKEVLEEKEALGTHLQLQCLKHPSQLTDVCKAEDFICVREGGCTLMCDTRLNCGHICKKMCHMISHENYKCNEICGKKMCINDHRCKKICWESCGDCMVLLKCKLPCGHMATLPCHKDPSEHECKEVVSVILTECKHTVLKECHVAVKDVLCSFPCDSRLPCGHICERKCHVTNDPEHLDYKCIRPCGRKSLECKEEHMCQKKCFEECSKCIYKVKRKLPKCEHFYDMECSADPGTFKCHKPCKKMLPCGHKCPLKCVEDCGNCQVVIEKEIADCKHKIKMKCCMIPERRLCTRKCERLLQCGHPCKIKCGLPCTSQKCESLLKENVASPCGHQVKVFCHEMKTGYNSSNLVKRCFEPCSKTLECNHICKGTCGGCLQGRIHIPCREKCGKNLICGHECTVSCSQSCPPCKKQCFIKCQHSKCRKKCGTPCASCKEKCVWQCEHFKCGKQCGQMCDRPPCNAPCKEKLKCGHPCIGFCGEICPPLCRVCNDEEVDEIQTWFGLDDDNERFVFLPDCKCVLPSKGLEKWLEMSSNTVKMKACPKCTTPIQNAYRYGNIVKQHFMDVMKVKSKVFGGIKKTNTSLLDASHKLCSVSKRTEFTKSQEHLRGLMDMLMRSKKERFDAFVLNSLEARTQFVLSIADHFKESKDKLDQSNITEYSNNANELIMIILRKLDFISPQEHSDISSECMRFHLILQLGAVESCQKFKTSPSLPWQETYKKCKNLFSSLKQFPKHLYEETHNKINELYKLLVSPIGVSKKEMNIIVNAINLHQGHWYTCPNGHVYVIENCGQAVTEGSCNECRERIGGRGILLSTNRPIGIPEGI